MKSQHITLIIEAEANKHVNEYMLKGFSKIESFRFALDKIKSLRKQEPLIVIHWELEKALIIKIANHESNI
jgi:hypothetical protein